MSTKRRQRANRLKSDAARRSSAVRSRARSEGRADSSRQRTRLPDPITTFEDCLLASVEHAWSVGWQPAELERECRRSLDDVSAGLVRLAIAIDHRRHAGAPIDRRWQAQIDDLDVGGVVGAPSGGWLSTWGPVTEMEVDVLGDLVLTAATHVVGLPRLDVLLPRPGFDEPVAEAVAMSGVVSDPLLAKVRGLLAKAESSTFEAEAEAFTAKAFELISRHAIDRALLDGGECVTTPVTIRIPIDPPYADAKFQLLHVVASAARCRSVGLDGLSMAIVFGYPDDLPGVELLYTSLLVQAASTLEQRASGSPVGSHRRSRSYRSAFHYGFADGVAKRLDDVDDDVLGSVDAAERASLLPVLRSRSDAIDDYVTQRFAHLGRKAGPRTIDSAGWASGRMAANLAHLGAGELR